MNLNTSRKIISNILHLVIAFSTVAFLLSLVMTFTAADQNFFVNQFASASLVSECNNQLNAKYEALASETNIPARVYERVKTDFPTDEALRQAALSVFSEENETLYSNNKINYFYELSVEYLEGNDMSYNEEDIQRSAQKAAEIYSEVVGLHNMGMVQARLADFSSKFPKVTIFSFVIVLVCFPAMMIMYKNKKDGYFKAIGGIFAGSIASAIGSMLFIVFNPGGGINILPEIHKSSIVKTSVKEFLILAFISLLLAASSFYVMRFADKKIRDED